MEFLATPSIDPSKPSLFELLSEHQLSSLLPPTLRYLLTLLVHRYPRHLLPALNSFDELYALSALLVERHYLLTRAGTFTEHFYSLKRERGVASSLPRAGARAPAVVRDALRLRTGDVWRNLAVVVGVPYLKRKLDEAHEVDAPRALLGAGYNARPARGAGVRAWVGWWWRVFLRRVYPGVNAGYYLALVAFQLGYLFDRTGGCHDPFLWMIGTRVRRMGAEDFRAVEKMVEGGGKRAGWVAKAMGGLGLVLPTSIFALKFLEWWYASDFAKQLSRKAGESLELPPPVVTGVEEGVEEGVVKRAKGGREKGDDEEEAGPTEETAPVAASSGLPIFAVPAPADSALCPICEDEITTATACQTGVVYCYTCIHKWMVGTNPRQEKFMADKAGKWESGEGRCAVTGRKVLGGTEGLRRIMV